MDEPWLSLSPSFCAGWADHRTGPPSVLPFCASKLLVPAPRGQLLSTHTHWSTHHSPYHAELPLGPAGCRCALWGDPIDGGPFTPDKAKRRAWGGETLRLLLWMSDREQRDPIYLKDKVTQRHSKEQFETAQKIEQEYSRYFTGRCASGPERKSRQCGQMPHGAAAGSGIEAVLLARAGQ